MLKIKNLSVKYGVINAVNNISLDIQKNKITTLIGANGAGKSSTLNAIMNLTKKDGIVLFEDKNISKSPTHTIVQSKIALVPEGRNVFINLSVDENLDLGGFNSNNTEGLKDKIYKLFPRLVDKKNQLAKNLSGGEQQMLAIARALMGQPKLLILDEPSLGLAPKIVSDVFKILQNLKDEGITIFLVEQNASYALKNSDFGYVLENGNIVLHDEAVKLLTNQNIIKKYLGG